MIIDDFLIRALLAGVGVALAAAPLGCFIVWQRMAYFGDATAHAALLGVALALMLNIPIFGGVLAVTLAMVLILTLVSDRGVGFDALLGVLVHSALALGLLAVSFLPNVRVDLIGYLFGDILAVSPLDLALIWGGAALVLGLLIWRWNALLITTVSPALAQASGIAARREHLILTLLLALSVAVALKVVGALLIAALMIIPAGAARPLARTPEGMALIAAALGTSAAIGGLMLSFAFDTPTGPTIVSLTTVMFAVTHLTGLAPRRGA